MEFKEVLFILCAICLMGCGSSSPRPPQGPSLLAGNWQLELAKTATATARKNQSGFFQENGSVVTGNLQMYTGDGACPGVGTVTGSQTGQNVSLTIDSPGQTETLTGTVDATGSTMSGTYAILSSGCGQSETGVWSAASVKPFSGNFTANMTANANGTQWIVSGSISQGASGGNVTAPVSGSMTSSDPTSTSSCFSAATFTGIVSGTSLIWNLTDSNGVQLGQFMLTFDPTSGGAAGKYVINKQTGTLPPGAICRSGEGGVVTVTFP
jgi:hypothetical protein